MSATKPQEDQPTEDEAHGPIKTVTEFFRNVFSKPSQAGEAAATALGPKREPFGVPVLVVEGPRRPKYLIPTHTWSPTEFKQSELSDFYVLNMDEGLEEVICWVRSATVSQPIGAFLKPVIYVIGPGHSLTHKELRLVNEELIPSGAYFVRRHYPATFESAVQSLRSQLEEQYGPPEKVDAWRIKEVAISG